MRLKWIGVIALSTLLLVGCSDEGVGGNEKISDEYVETAFEKLNEKRSGSLPQSVEDGTVSEDMYLESARYITEFVDYEENMFGYQDRLNSDLSLYDDKQFIKEYKQSMDDYEVFIKGFQLSPSTKADGELYDNLNDTLEHTSTIISSLRQYIDTKESYHISSLKETMNKRNTSYKAFTNTVKKYDLNSIE